MKKKRPTISKPEYMLLVAALAQKQAGNRNPTPAEMEKAIAAVKVDMAKRGIAPSWTSGDDASGNDTSGAFWGRLKDAAASILPTAKKAAPYALPALLASTVATPFMIKAIMSAKEAKKSETAAKDAAAEANPSAAEPAAEEEAPSEKLSVPGVSGAFVGSFVGSRGRRKVARTSDEGAVEREASTRFAGGAFVDGEFVDGAFVGLDPWVHMLSPSYWFKSSREKRLIDAERKLGKENVAEQKRLQEQRKELNQAEKTMATAQAARAAKAESEAVEQRLKDIEQSVSSGVGNVTKIATAKKGQKVAKENAESASTLIEKLDRGEKLDEDDREELRKCLLTCGMLRDLHKQLHASGMSGEYSAEIVGSFVGSSVPNEVYRAAIWQRASKLSGGRRPSTRAVAIAKKSVDKTLSMRGASIKVPGARPGRVTR